MNAKAATPSHFWDRKARGYARQPIADESAYEATLDRVKAHLTPRDRVLEVGCGTGSTALKLAPFAGELLATDGSREMIAIANEKAATAACANVRFAQADFVAARFAPASFEVVMAFNMLHLLVDVPGAVAQIRGWLKPGGLFISKTPCIGEYNVLMRSVIPLLRAFGQAPFVNYLKEASLQRDIAAAGFDIVESALYSAKNHNLFIVARRLD